MGLWGAILPSVIGAVGGALNARSQRKAVEAANRPQPYHETTTTTPGLGTEGPLRDTVPMITDWYSQMSGNMTPPPRRGGGGGGPAVSDYTRGLFEDYAERARGGSEMLDSAENYITGRMTGADNRYDIGPIRDINNLQGMNNPLMNDAYRRSGTDPASGYYHQFIQGLMPPSAGASSPSSGGGGGGYYYGGGGGGGIGGGGKISIDAPEADFNYDNPLLQEYMEKTLRGEYLNDNPHLEEIADRIRKKSSEAEAAAVADLTRREAGAGRFGRGRYGAERAAVSEQMNEAMTGSLAQLFGNSYENERARMAQMAGLINSRDVARWNDITQRYGIDTGRNIAEAEIEGRIRQSQIGAAATTSAAGASAGAARYAADAQERMHRLSTTLGAIQGLSGADLGRLGVAADLAGTWGDQQLGAQGLDLQRQMANQGMDLQAGMANQGANLQADLTALGAAPGMYQTPFGPLGDAVQMGMGIDQAEARRRAAAAERRYQDDMAAWQWQQNRPGDLLQQRTNMLMGIGLPFAGQHTEGMRTPQQQVAPSTAGGILGGAMAGLGAYGSLREMGLLGGNRAPSGPAPLNYTPATGPSGFADPFVPSWMG